MGLLAKQGAVLESIREKASRSDFYTPQVNVAIAAAVTSHARILMHQFKDINTFYTDTDSIFTSQALPSHMVGKDLGLMKNELEGKAKGGLITRDYFLGLNAHRAYMHISILILTEN